MFKGMGGILNWGKKNNAQPKGVRRAMAAERMVVLECGGRASLVAAIEGQRIDLYVFSHDPTLVEPFGHVDTLKLPELPSGASISLFEQNPACPEEGGCMFVPGTSAIDPFHSLSLCVPIEPCLLVGSSSGALLEVSVLLPLAGERAPSLLPGDITVTLLSSTALR